MAAVAASAPFRAWTHARDPAASARALVFSPPTDHFSAIPKAIRYRDFFLSLVAFTAILSEVMPILLTNVPYGLIRTRLTQEACTWLATAILCWMIVVVVASCMRIRWVALPAEPNSIAGVLYYVADSEAAAGFQAARLRSEKELEAP